MLLQVKKLCASAISKHRNLRDFEPLWWMIGVLALTLKNNKENRGKINDSWQVVFLVSIGTILSILLPFFIEIDVFYCANYVGWGKENWKITTSEPMTHEWRNGAERSAAELSGVSHEWVIGSRVVIFQFDWPNLTWSSMLWKSPNRFRPDF